MPEAAPRPSETVEPTERWKGVAEKGSAVATGLDAIAAADKSFDANHFIAGARAAYEMIVGAFAAGDRRALKNLLAREVYDGFDAAIRERESKGETVESRFVSLETAEIIGAEMRGYDRAGHRALRLAIDHRDARQIRQRGRRQSRQGHRRHRCVDLCPRPDFARSELETGGDRSGAMIFSRRRRLRAVTRRGAVAATLALATAIVIALAPAADAARKRGAPKRDPLKIPNSAVELAAWENVEGWAEDNHAEALGAFLTSCRAIMRSSKGSRTPVQSALNDICERAIKALPLDTAGARAFFEKNFRPMRIAPLGETRGLLHRLLRADHRRRQTAERRVHDAALSPSRRHAGQRGCGIPRKRAKFGKRVVKKSAPYYDRVAIEDGALAGRDLEIAYVNVIDAFFAQIQGSVRVRLEDGTMLRLNYDAQNGHPYTAVGRFLVERKIYTREEISMQKIREWMEANPEEGKALRRMNKSYVFFRETSLGAEDEPPGAQGVALTPGRSIAVDRKLHTYGMPFFIDALLPIQSEKPDTIFRRLMVAQDTGGAIIGPARADIYLGAGDEAARAAGRFKQFGRFVMLVPNELDPARLERPVPLPLPRPKIDEPFKLVERRDATPAPAVIAPAARDRRQDGSAAESESAQEKAMSRDEARKGRRLSEEETKLWRGVVKSVAPLRKRVAAAAPKTDDHPPSPPKPAPKKLVACGRPCA